jgi:FtsH-binding integral membrane protein
MYAAASKLSDYQTFRLQLGKSPYITKMANIIVWAIPGVEILISLLLTFKKTRLTGLYGALFLMTIFTAYIFSMLQFSYYIPCSCGGILSQMDWQTHFWFNLGFVGISIVGIFLESKRLKLIYNL